jgi:hypothetical protein
MAELSNDTGALRFALALVQREAGAAAPARLLATTGLEYRDQRDSEWWPIVRLPAFFVAPAAIERLVAGLADVVRGGAEGFAWRPAEDAAFAVQVGPEERGAVLEIGLDLGGFLADAAGVVARRDAELALFRFRAAQADLVRFSDGLQRELEVLRR